MLESPRGLSASWSLEKHLLTGIDVRKAISAETGFDFP
jgi:hypothetical protein